MTDNKSPITTSAQLQTAFVALLAEAHVGGVDVRGGWDCHNDDGHPDWDVVVTEVETDGTSE